MGRVPRLPVGAGVGGSAVNGLIAGASSGFLMASVFVSAGVLMLFPMVREPSPGLQAILRKYPPGSLVFPVVLVAYPVWGVVGVVMGLLYEISVEQAPGAGLGSPNLVYTAAVLLATIMLAAPFLILLRRVIAGVIAIALAFVGVFGWFLPYFAT